MHPSWLTIQFQLHACSLICLSLLEAPGGQRPGPFHSSTWPSAQHITFTICWIKQLWSLQPQWEPRMVALISTARSLSESAWVSESCGDCPKVTELNASPATTPDLSDHNSHPLDHLHQHSFFLFPSANTVPPTWLQDAQGPPPPSSSISSTIFFPRNGWPFQWTLIFTYIRAYMRAICLCRLHNNWKRKEIGGRG